MATLGAAERRAAPKVALPKRSRPKYAAPREGSEAPPWRGAGLRLGRLGQRRAAQVTTHPA
eukprot:14163538-Alexandrium_andersonii.AAC.1